MDKKILVVDDSSLMVAVIRNFIKKDFPDAIVIEASSGEQSLEKYKQEKPNLVFMDIKMSGIDGIEALKEIKQIDFSAKVVMCTSLKEPEQEKKAKDLGCVGYIMKPFSKQDIADAIKNNL
jgi:two-component system chemotaxis response regulator CheY